MWDWPGLPPCYARCYARCAVQLSREVDVRALHKEAQRMRRAGGGSADGAGAGAEEAGVLQQYFNDLLAQVRTRCGGRCNLSQSKAAARHREGAGSTHAIMA